MAAAAAAAAASKYTGRYALHPLLPGAAQAVADACVGKLHPSWTGSAQSLFGTWEKLAVCLPRYAAFIDKCNRKDLKRPHVFMNEKAQAALGEFYLCCALRMREKEVEEAGQDSEKLLALASEVAQQDVEPFFQECRDFVSSYNEALHRRLDDTTIWREVEDGLFWHHSFEVVADEAYAALRREALPAEADWPEGGDSTSIAAVLESFSAAVREGGPSRKKAEVIYRAFLEASAMPVKCSLRTALIDHGILYGEVRYRGRQPSEAPE
mmetsp:Transcript_59225/g.138671  ORF Transcript_59225/g.138671 Transcript_59225/m.138671 type:complete len:267 (-) Transcript_59225:70-870(-)|eukprot:s7055_g3.t1